MLIRTFLVLLLTLLTGVKSLRILGIFGHAGRTHFEVFRPLLEALTKRGHELTVIGYFPSEKNLSRYNDIVMRYPGEELKHTFNLKDIKGERIEKYLAAPLIRKFGLLSCEIALQSEDYRKLLESQEKFDIIVTEFFNSNCWLIPILDKFKIPFIGLTSHVLLPWTNDWVGNPDNPAYVPVAFLDNSYEMSFVQRLENAVMLLFNKFYFSYFIENDEFEMTRKYTGKSFSHVRNIMYNTSLILTYSHFTLHGARPFVPNVIEVAGMHLEEHKKFPSNIEKWIKESTHGVIYFSLGSMIKGHTFPEEKRQMFLRVFGSLPQRVLWKWETEMLGKPDNVMIESWMPQFDILCHPNVKAFISHGGLLGTTEAVHCGVPMVVMPQFGDQFTNAKAVEASGGGVVLDFRSLSEDSIREALQAVLDPSFNEKAKALSARFRDRPLPPLDTAIYWVEYVARHGGAPHMRTAAVGMPFFRYLLLDVALFLTILGLIYAYIQFLVAKWLYYRIFGENTPPEKEKKN